MSRLRFQVQDDSSIFTCKALGPLEYTFTSSFIRSMAPTRRKKTKTRPIAQLPTHRRVALVLLPHLQLISVQQGLRVGDLHSAQTAVRTILGRPRLETGWRPGKRTVTGLEQRVEATRRPAKRVGLF